MPTQEKTSFASNKFRPALLKSVCAFAMLAPFTAAAAQTDPSMDALEARVTKVEAKLDAILTRLEAGDEDLTAADAAALQEARALMKAHEGASQTHGSGGSVQLRSTAQIQPVLLETDTPGGVSAQKTAPPAKSDALKFSAGNTDFTFKGFIKLDATITDFSGGDLPSSSIGRDFYIPGLIPVDGDGNGPDFDFNPRETRFIFAVDTDRGGYDIGGLIEFDFQVTSDGNERVSNSFTPRMRQAYVTIDNWLLGQAWSTFQDVSALPDNLDFIGPTEGTVFIRQPMIRYTRGPWQIALEQPETEITGPTGARLLPGDDVAPDVVVRYNHKRDWGHVTLAGLARAIHIEDDIIPGAVSDTAIGYGVSASGKIKVGKRDDVRFMATYGDGIGRYIGVNIVNDAAINSVGELSTIQTLSGFASYRHFWAPKLRSNLTGGYFKADNPVTLTGGGVTDEVFSVHANLIYTPVDKIDVGIEYIYARRSLENGLNGNMNRVQFSTKYSF